MILRKKVEKYGTLIESWYPIGHGDKSLIEHELFTKLGKKYNKTNVQVILRWHIQKGNIVFPKSSNPKHIKENSEIFDFKLTDDEMKEIDKMEKPKDSLLCLWNNKKTLKIVSLRIKINLILYKK